MNDKKLWAPYPTPDSLTMYLCYDHYRMGSAEGEAHRHWVLPPPDDSCACIICASDELRAEVGRLEGMIRYALDGPDDSECLKRILSDALDGMKPNENFDQIRGERKALKAEIERLKRAQRSETTDGHG